MAFTLLSFVFLAIICLFDPHSGEIAAMANIYVPAVLHLCRKYSPLQSGSSLGRLQGPRHSNKAGNRTPVILPTVSHFIVPTWCCVTSVCMGGCVLLLLLLLTVTSSDSFAGDPVTSEPGNTLYWTPSSTPARDTLLSPNIQCYNYIRWTVYRINDQWLFNHY